MGNFFYKVEEFVIEKYFLDCGSIMVVRIVRDKMIGIGKGFGYVFFENIDFVYFVLKLNNFEFMGRKFRVMCFVNKEKFK